ncbi:hypothetical protein Aperf_G00000130705 [Anoplocephala perfoliata]
MNGGCSGVSDSSDDEEYIPTAELEEESTEESQDDLSDGELEKASPEQKESKSIGEKDRDEIWNDFLRETKSQTDLSSSCNSRNLQAVKRENPPDPIPSDFPFCCSDKVNNQTILSIGRKRPAQTTNNRLNEAIKKLKSSTLNPGVPKISTLEKSRIDWETFTEKEGIKDDLKLHNKGKDGYVERKAFQARAQEREYQMLKEARLRNFQRR